MNSKRNILYKFKVWPVHNDLLLLTRSTHLQGNDFVLLGHLKRGGGKKGKFDNSVRKLQHRGNKTFCKIFFP
jgi:hypothetical protein